MASATSIRCANHIICFLTALIYCQFIGFCILSGCVNAQNSKQEFPSKKLISKWGSNLEDRLKSNMTNVTGHHILQQHYNKYNPQATHFDPLKTEDIVKEISTSLTEMLEKSKEALKNSVNIAEAVAANYAWKPDLKIGNITYFDSTSLADDDLLLEYHPRFQQPVNLSASSVHIPVEIYKGGYFLPTPGLKPTDDIDILNGLGWSAQLDKVFEDNYNKNKKLLWQYFGSQSGFMRMYPASRWRTHGSVDLFDVRRRPWYTQGASSPKDMMIIIDTSGSVHGQALQLIKVAVKSLLDTLGENDFVNIAHFSKDASFVSCFNDTFVQANYRNKKILTKAVENLTAHDMANFKEGFKFAFEQFEVFRNKSKQNGVGAQCNEVIMLLTDGGTDNAKEVFEKYNWSKNKSVRVFTYAVGPTANPTSAIRWMACSNRGYFSQIPAMGAIRSKVQEFLKHMGGPPGTASYYFHWSLGLDRSGLGMVTTVTLPVYNRTLGANNQTILGVMGVDITTDDMLKKIERHKLGPLGYAFAINRNGYVVFHPNLKIPKDWNKDPPNVDFLEVEVENEQKEELRRRMIDGDSGTMEIQTFVVSPDGNHAWLENRTYSFVPIQETSFSLCISVPSHQKKYMQPMGITVHEAKALLHSNLSAMLIAPWDYYSGYSKEDNITMTAEDLINVLDYTNDHDNYLMQLLFWDANITKKMELYWHDVDIFPQFKFRDDVIATFVGTNGGLTMVYPASEKDRYVMWRDVWKADYYQRAMQVDYFVYTAPYRKGSLENSTAPPITVVKSVKINNSIKTAVIGVTMNHSRIMEELLTASDYGNSDQYHCRESDKLICYLLDDGAFVISTNQEDKLGAVGQFLGNVDRGLMFGLINRTVYVKHEISDFQATCMRKTKKSAGGLKNIRVPSVNLLYEMLSWKWWFNKVAWSYFSFNIYNWFFSEPVNFAYAEEESESESCIMNRIQYYWPSSTFNSMSGIVPCENCSREFRVVRLMYSNLVLVVTELECNECSYTEINQEPEEVKPNFCESQPRYRKRPGECYKYDAREDDKKCSGSANLPSYFVLLTALFLLRLCVYLSDS
ncbi:voltage-dependent calcium channel subunit alpha-2/delta-2 isoform X3 [Octopus bimaculoides]|uniref:voltage-dependent calcium channel subunit alpha-2/delta-2 isoform X3 n=1 Tax=Octopus bimaculoides TaxID=37653 RepID=UPI0022E79881|nr:voltage-dependent calcium channel subunit alpha-2/delta-2 isoform X3 [Octopus bimaculoides]